MTPRTYKGYQIRDWSGPYGSNPDGREPRYYVQTKHTATGIDWSPECCPKAHSLRQAREIINEMVRV